MFGGFAQVAFQGAKSDEERCEISRQLLKRASDLEGNNLTVPEFPKNLEWLNTAESLTFGGHLRGKVVVLDFFTYCCINCMHILPDLHDLEREISVEAGLAVIGVHSAKFENEKVSQNVLNAVTRYDISHPVVNDYLNAMWEDLEVSCWPTLVVVGPSGEIIVTLVGESNREALFSVCRTAVDHYSKEGKISHHALPIKLYKDSVPASTLCYPGKVAAFGDRLAVSDTGHHRILVTDLEGLVVHCVGGDEPGWHDGHFEEARFHSPQGVCWSGEGDRIYVADTENHSIRMIHLSDGTVSTIAGTGVMGSDALGGTPARDQPLSSPWDVTLGSPHEDILFIAMAGNHTIWGLFLETAAWQKGSEHKKGICMNYAGTGKEENRNNSYPHRAAFAQPSGITLAPKEPHCCMFIADSESSTVRAIKFKDGAVKAVVGGERDPKNLFAFGDEDGVGIDAKLQHPLGVAWNPADERLYLADSYNHKIKVIDPSKKSCATFAGSGTPGKADSTDLSLVWLNEPGGLCIAPDGQKVYVADTNNHAIRVIYLDKKSVKELPIVFSRPATTETEADSVELSPITSKRAVVIETPAREYHKDSRLTLDIRLPPGHKLTPDAPSCYQAYLAGEENVELKGLSRVSSLDASPAFDLELPPATARGVVRVEAVIYYCSSQDVCLMKELVFLLPVTGTVQSEQVSRDVTLTYTLDGVTE